MPKAKHLMNKRRLVKRYRAGIAVLEHYFKLSNLLRYLTRFVSIISLRTFCHVKVLYFSYCVRRETVQNKDTVCIHSVTGQLPMGLAMVSAYHLYQYGRE